MTRTGDHEAGANAEGGDTAAPTAATSDAGTSMDAGAADGAATGEGNAVRAAQAVETLRGLSRDADALSRVVRDLSTEPTLANVSKQEAAAARLIEALASSTWLPAPLASTLQRVAENAQADARELRERGPRLFWQHLQRVVADAGRSLTRTGESPLAFRIGWVTFTCDFDGSRAHAALGLEPLRDVPLDPVELLRFVDAFDEERRALPPGRDAFHQVVRAYRATCALQGVELGARVDLVDLVPALALLGADAARVRRQGVRAIADVPRWRLAMLLARIRSERCLEVDGQRLDLGSATGHSTRTKANVLHVPVSERDGQYYLTIRVIGRGIGEPAQVADEAAAATPTGDAGPADATPAERDHDAAHRGVARAVERAAAIDQLGQRAFDALLDRLDGEDHE